VRKNPVDLEPFIVRWDADGPGIDVGHLVHGLLDALVDGQFRAAGQVGDLLDEFEASIFDRSFRDEHPSRGFDLRKALIQTRRYAAPMREVHVVTITEAVDVGLDIVSSLLDSQANEQGNELNDVAKKLASLAAVIAVPTAVTGFYGQNVPFPGIGHYAGTITSITAMVILTLAVYALLRHRHWL
jgi:magnesium transporter